MSKNKLVIKLFPHFVKQLVDNGTITIEQLLDLNKASTILSKNIVNKIKATQNLSGCALSKQYIETMYLSWYYNYNTKHELIENDFLRAQFAPGEEGYIKDVVPILNNFMLGFTFKRIRPNLYVIYLNPLVEVDTGNSYVPGDNRKECMRNSMLELLNDASAFHSNKDLQEEDLFLEYSQLTLN